MVMDPASQTRVLLTGAAGRIGSAFFAAEAGRYRFRLADRGTGGLQGAAGHEVVALDVADLAACRAACDGVDVVVHLAADPSPEADFSESLLENNIKGTYNVFRARRTRGAGGWCSRAAFTRWSGTHLSWSSSRAHQYAH